MATIALLIKERVAVKKESRGQAPRFSSTMAAEESMGLLNRLFGGNSEPLFEMEPTVVMLPEDRYWALISDSMAATGGEQNDQAEYLTAALTELSPADIVGFRLRTDKLLFDTYNSDGAWYQLYSGDGSLHGRQFGFGTDVVTPADHDGDGKTDIAVYRPSEGYWYIANSSDGSVRYAVFGLAQDIPAPGDFDGDGKADISIFRPSDGTWYRTNSSDGSFYAFPFGAAGDKPAMTAFRY